MPIVRRSMIPVSLRRIVMLSPFPGMDPYLENLHTWPDLHNEMISCMRAALNESIQPKYVARIEDRIYVSDERDPGRRLFVPDVRIHETATDSPRLPAGGTAVLTATEPVVSVTLLDEEMHESRLTIIDVATRSIVTVIEILSPTNKYPGARGRDSYMEKRQEVLSSPTHLVEVDLLRNGVPTFLREGLKPHHYAVHVSENEMRPRSKRWPILLSERLPVIEIPLKKEDGHVGIDLQRALAEAYHRGASHAVVDYSKPPVPPLTGEWDAWAKSVIARASS
jgi:hypothetical protein